MTSDEEQGVELNQTDGFADMKATVINAVSDDASLMEDIDIDNSNVKNESAISPGEDEQLPPPPQLEGKTILKRFLEFYRQYEFLILLIVVVLLAKAYPPLGAKYLAPKITATYIAVIYIFCKLFASNAFYAYEGSIQWRLCHLLIAAGSHGFSVHFYAAAAARSWYFSHVWPMFEDGGIP